MSIEPLNDNIVKFFLDFRSDGSGKFEIDEPVGFDAANFVLFQEDDRYGRDISYAAGEVEMRFYKKVSQHGHQFDRLMHYFDTYGYESVVRWIVQIGGVDYVIGELDFGSAKTDQKTYLECMVVRVMEDVPLNRRHDIEFDLLSGEDLDGNSLPFPGTQQLKNVFLRPNIYRKVSKWTMSDPIDESLDVIAVYWNNFNQIEQDDISGTRTFGGVMKGATAANRKHFICLEAEKDLKNVQIKVSNLSFTQTGHTYLKVVVDTEIGFDSTEQELEFFDSPSVNNYSNEFTIPDIPLGSKVAIYFHSVKDDPEDLINVTSGNIEFSLEEAQIPVVLKALTLGFAIRRLIQSVSGQTITAEFSEEFQNRIRDQYAFNGLMLRGFSTEDTKLILTFETLLKYLQEINADYQLRGDKVFFGVYEDFYTDEEIGVFTTLPNEEFYMTFNERYLLNKLTFNYEKFEDDRDKENILNSFHTESSWFIRNRLTHSNKDIEIPFIRDSFLINTTREYNIDQKNSNSTKNDDDIFILDCLTNQTIPEQQISFRGALKYDEQANETQITNSQFDFRAIGLRENSTVKFSAIRVEGDNIPLDSWTLTEFEKGLITLSGGDSAWETDEYVITLKYTPNASITNRGSEPSDGFYAVENANATVLSNLRFTLKRNILNYWGAFLRTCTIYSGVDIQNTYFKNNGQLITGMQGDPWPIPIQENKPITQDLLPEPVLSANEYNFEIKAPFSAVDTIIKGMRDTRGYIRLIDNRGKVIKVYPKHLDYDWERNVLLGTGEEKYEGEYLDIVATGGVVTVNDTGYDSTVVNRIRYTIEDEYLQLFDVNMYPLNNKKLFKQVRVNGQTFNTIEDLARELEKYDEE